MLGELLAALPGALGQGLILCAEIAAVVLPLLFGYELAKAYGVFERPWPGLRPVMAFMGLGPGAVVPLLAGLFLGILYGAGIMISLSREQGLAAAERLALGVFLVTCHAVVEDTAIFVLLGGSAFFMLVPRLVLAVGLTAWLARRGRARRGA
ncbi:MAG: nucleoside recognition protein [Desulfarculus sp.]|nr:MAG: nucleoside recognition protein [Desulfarculus sp.]